MNTIEKLGDEETFKQIVERSITSFTDDELKTMVKYSFYGCKELQEVSLPLVTKLPESAFNNCSKLTAFNWSDITEIGHSAFSRCGFTEVNVPLVTSTGQSAFYSCPNLTHAKFSKATSIDFNAFQECSNLTNVEFPEATSINSYAFYKCRSLVNVEFPKVTSLTEDTAFFNCSNITRAKFPKITTIYSGALRDCVRLSTLIVGTEFDDETTICRLLNTDALPSSIRTIYVPFTLLEKYKTATNWSSFASKIQAYDVPISCQSLTITAEDVPWYGTSTKVQYEAVCTYSIEGTIQTGTKVFKGDAVSNTFDTNPSEESSRQVEVSYTFLGQTATTTITQGKHQGNPVGGKIYYIDDTADGTYSFYDAEGNLMSDVSVGSTPSSYKVLTAGSKDKYYVYRDEIYNSLKWGKSGTSTGATGTEIGTGKSNTAALLGTDAVSSTETIWYKLQQVRNASLGYCNDWFVPSKSEAEELRKTKFSASWFSKDIWSSSEYSTSAAIRWDDWLNNWDDSSKNGYNSVFFIRAF